MLYLKNIGVKIITGRAAENRRTTEHISKMEMIDCHMPNYKEQEGVYNIEKFLARLERLLTYDLRMSPFKISLL